MFISHEYALLYLKTEKTASTAIENFFATQSGLPVPEQGRNVNAANAAAFLARQAPGADPFYHHMSAAEVRALLPGVFRRYRRVTSIRNPFSKCVSQFYWKKRDSALTAQPAEAQIQIFREWLRTDDITASDRNKYLLGEEIVVDYVVHYERLTRELTALCARLGLPWDVTQLSVAKGGYRNIAIPFANFYDDAAADVVREKFGFEFRCFGYSDDPANASCPPTHCA
jgi:hypothetical protein